MNFEKERCVFMQEQEEREEKKENTAAESAAEEKAETSSAQTQNRQQAQENAPQPNSDEIVQKKLVLSLAYVFGILFFLPLIVYPNDAEARFHANQSLLVLLTAIVGEVVFGILTLIPAVGIVFSILCGVFGLLILLLCIYAIVCICRGEKGELPILGRIRLIK